MNAPMIAAVYARKSTEQVGIDADATSVALQIASARAFATARGWTVSDANIYADEAVSGAEVKRLVQRERLLATIHAGAPFQVLLMRDTSRFSRRDGDEAFAELKTIARAGVDIWCYQDGTRFEYGNFAANVVGVVRAEMNAEYRRQIATWTTAAQVRKVRAGHAVGGRTFGYDTVKVAGHVERRINDAEAAVVRQIFDRCAAGTGYTRIAKQLNAEHAVCPRPQGGRPAGWSPSTIYEILHRPLYRGVVIWNKTRKRNAAGQTAPTARPTSEWLHVDAPELRIVTDEQWEAAHARLRGIRTQLATVAGPRPTVRRDAESKYLLSGFLRCAMCGGTVSVVSRAHGGKRAYFYGCLAHNKRGDTICANALVLPVARLDQAVLRAVAGDVLRPAVITAIVAAVFEALQPAAVAQTVDVLQADLKALDRKIANLTAAIEIAPSLPPILAQLQARQTERDALLARIGAADAVTRIQLERPAVQAKVLARVADWQALLATSSVADGRRLLREVLAGPLRLTPDGRSYRFEGEAATGALVTGAAGISPLLASPTGLETQGPSRLNGRFERRRLSLDG